MSHIGDLSKTKVPTCGWEGCTEQLLHIDEQFLCRFHQGHPAVQDFEQKTGQKVVSVVDDGGNSIGLLIDEEDSDGLYEEEE